MMASAGQVQGPEQQGDATASGLSLLGALVIVARKSGLHLAIPQLIHDHLLEPGQPSVAQLLYIAEESGLRASSTRLAWRDLPTLDKALPAIALMRDGRAMVLREVDADAGQQTVSLEDPDLHDDKPLILDELQFTASWTGEILLFKRDYRRREDDQPFGPRLILNHLMSDRRAARDIGVCALMLSCLAVTPLLFWRFLIDKVLYYHALDTFTVLCVVMAILIAFETGFFYLRKYLVLLITRRMDAKVSNYMFDKLLNLPIDFFERKPVGEITRDLGEMHRIRQFLTGTMLGTVLDAMVLFVFVPIMFFYSPLLTFYILGFAALICGWIILRLPELKRRNAAVFKVEGEKNAFLVETLHGIRAVKSLALDNRRRQEWDVKVAEAAQLRFQLDNVANNLNTVVTPLHHVMVYGVFALAVVMAIVSTTNQSEYLGAMIVFMLLSQRVAQPLMQLAQMGSQVDDVRLAVATIADLINRPPEEGRSKNGIRTPIVGRVEFAGVRFAYLGSNTPALDDVSFTVPEGTVFGIMGRSGSGKTTVTRLMQLFHSDYEGLIKVDGVDLRQYDIDHLRTAFGVVMQENFLFSGTIRETITASKPDATFDEMVIAARLAGAEEFIERLPNGYETFIYEGSPNFSGGQKQRLAIARALITNPPILILDEATSALDAESEAIVNANLMRMAEGRTVIIISHRLSILTGADAILVLERGRNYDVGPHSELVERCDIYRNLWLQQNRHLLPGPTHEVVSFRPAHSA